MTWLGLSILYFACGGFLFYQAWVHAALMRAHSSEVTTPNAGCHSRLPMVVQLPMFNEPLVVLRLLDATVDLAWPVPFTIQILDDSTDDTSSLVDQWLKNYKGPHVIHHMRRTRREGYKAGALQAGLNVLEEPSWIAIFDADFVPPRDFLELTASRLLKHPNAAVVQARWDHLNADVSPLTAVQALNLDAHFAVEQEGRQRLGVWNSFNGTAGVWRSEAIEAAGGWSHDTLAEDLDLSIRTQKLGWEIVYADDIGAPAELPDSMEAYLGQQRRWTQGGAACAAKHLREVRKALGSGRKQFHATAQLLASSIHLPVWGMTTLSVPLVVQATVGSGSHWPLRWAAIFMLTLCMFILLYWTAALRRNRTRDFPIRMLTMLVLGSGTTWHNAKAAWAGWRRTEAEFVRTPKRGGGEPTLAPEVVRAGWTLTGRSGEWLHAIWFGLGACWGVMSGEWGLVPFHLLLMAGYIWVAWAARH
ncbi:MAG: glycosyltransferase family 2 protein [Flavobacteriales bacterium]